MTLIGYRDIPYRDDEAFKTFMDIHALDHQSINNALLSQGLIIPFLPIGSENDLTEVWLEIHDRIHKGIDENLNIENVDFSFLDMNDRQSYEDWLESHADQHDLYLQALSFT